MMAECTPYAHFLQNLTFPVLGATCRSRLQGPPLDTVNSVNLVRILPLNMNGSALPEHSNSSLDKVYFAGDWKGDTNDFVR